jgi:hypothetical protein
MVDRAARFVGGRRTAGPVNRTYARLGTQGDGLRRRAQSVLSCADRH